MKYAKKMKLVDIDDVTHSSSGPSNHSMPSDDNFITPRILSLLDNAMNDILNRSDVDDGEKWILYNQSLQRYLNYMKKTRSPNINTQHATNTQLSGSEQWNRSLNPFDSHTSDHNLTGIVPIRDSIDNISQPNVRQFFEHARESISPIAHISSEPSLSAMDIPDLSPLQQQLSRKKTPSRIRAVKRNASQNLSGRPPNKVVPRSLFRERRQAQSRFQPYWEATNAR